MISSVVVDVSAECVRAAIVSLYEGFVDHDHRLAARVVRRKEPSAAEKRDTESAFEIGFDKGAKRRRIIRPALADVFANEDVMKASAPKRDHRRRRHVTNAWDGANGADRGVVVAVDLLGRAVACAGGEDVERRDVVRVEAWIDARQSPEGLHQQSGAKEQGERRRDLRDNQHVACGARAANTPAPTAIAK